MTTTSQTTRAEASRRGAVDDLANGTATATGTTRYTLHLDFITDDADQAMALAAALADGLAVLRPEVDAYTARISVPGTANDPQPLFCAVNGPEGAVCADFNGHASLHAEAGVNGLRWSDSAELPGRSAEPKKEVERVSRGP